MNSDGTCDLRRKVLHAWKLDTGFDKATFTINEIISEGFSYNTSLNKVNETFVVRDPSIVHIKNMIDTSEFVDKNKWKAACKVSIAIGDVNEPNVVVPKKMFVVADFKLGTNSHGRSVVR